MKKTVIRIVLCTWIILSAFIFASCSFGKSSEKEETYSVYFLISNRYTKGSNSYYEYNTQHGIKTYDDIVFPDSPQKRKPQGSYLPHVRSDGFTFVGWSLDEKTVYAPENAFEVTDTMRFYALYTVNEYTVEYQTDGGINDERNPGSYTVEDYEITLYPAVKTGYTFDGWHDYTNGKDTFYDPSYEKLEAENCRDVILRAYWTPIEYDIQYYVKSPSFTKPEGDLILTYTIETETPLRPLAREGYTFLGWFDNEDYTGDPIETIPAGSYGFKAFYAKWEINQ